MCAEVYAGYVCACRMRDSTLHRAQQAKGKGGGVCDVYLGCAAQAFANGGGATRFEFLNFHIKEF